MGRDVWNRFNASKDSEAWYNGFMLEAFAAGDESIKDTAAFLEYGKCVGEVFGDSFLILSKSDPE